MFKIVGVKELQLKTKYIRQEVEKGTHFIVIWRSKPIFEIKPLDQFEFAEALEQSDLYKKEFVQRMKQAEIDIKKGKVRAFSSTEAFFKSLS